MKFAILPSADGQYYFVLKSRNGQTVMTSETYKRKRSARRAIDSIKTAFKKNIPVFDFGDA